MNEQPEELTATWIALEDKIVRVGGRLVKKHKSIMTESLSMYFTLLAVSEDEEWDALQKDENFEIPEASIRIATHANMSGKSEINFNIAPESGKDIDDVVAWLISTRAKLGLHAALSQ